MRAADNPFRSRKVESLAYRGAAVSEIYKRWLQNGMRGAIIGSHGHGKTTLLLELYAIAKREGLKPKLITLRLENGAVQESGINEVESSDVVFVDSIDLRFDLYRKFGSAKGLLVSAHDSSPLPTLHLCSTSLLLLRELVDELVSANIEDVELSRLWDIHNHDLRQVFRELYDQYAGKTI